MRRDFSIVLIRRNKKTGVKSDFSQNAKLEKMLWNGNFQKDKSIMLKIYIIFVLSDWKPQEALGKKITTFFLGKILKSN